MVISFKYQNTWTRDLSLKIPADYRAPPQHPQTVEFRTIAPYSVLKRTLSDES